MPIALGNDGRHTEATITIEGVPLTVGQSMTIRVALNHFLSSLEEEGLGDDDHGKAMVKNYTARGREILTLIHQHIT